MYYFEHFAERLPLELFVFIGTFVEELLAPIPSLLVLVPAGAAALAQGEVWWYLIVLAILSAAGRALGASCVYWLADKIEDTLLAKNRRLFGYSHADIERFGARLSGTKRDWLLLFSLNMLPAMPPVLPLACGFLKVRYVVFVTATFFGNILSAATLLYAGYGGLQAARAVQNVELVGQILMGLIILALLAWFIIRHWRRK